MRTAVSLRRGWIFASLSLYAACGSDPEVPADGAAGSTVAAGSSAAGRGSVGLAGQPSRAGRSGGVAGRASSAGRSGAAGTPVVTAGRSGTTAGSSALAGRPAAGTTPTPAGSGAVGTATFTQVYAIITARCAGASCHVGATGTGGGNLVMNDRASAHKNLVGVNAAICRGEKRVLAGNVAKSELIHTLARTQIGSCAAPQMPLALPKLAQTEIDTVTAWVSAGAPNN
jgi:hypothetical protein